ncbi:hypothetical protein NliqN6_1142 [Naganishia liquefaciens]|uniref:PepSY domain-containing protein n=1 Tax=Naganishia liquefaciens TaxID=104408 RepID=A0A8H3TPC4_9TREE|nr:hypothetical protein NliqN6_1142 [Naganishia liquefaciens]
MHISSLVIGVIATTSVTAAALPRGRSRSRAHSAATFLKLRSSPAPKAERFVILPEDSVQTEKRDVVSADVYHRPTAGDDSAAVHVSTESINTSSGKNTQQPDLGDNESASSAIVESLLATSSMPFETFTYSNYAPAVTSTASSEPSASTGLDPVQEAIKAAESYALKQQNVALPTVTVHLVMEPTQEADGKWDYIVKVGADGTATASPTFVPAATATPTTSSVTDYYVPSATAISAPEASASIIVGEQSAPITSSAEAATPSYYYGNTHTWTGESHANSSVSVETEQSVPPIDSTIRNLLTTSSHFAFQCADATSYYYSESSDATQICPGGTVCRFVDTACSPCVWPDQDIWCAGKIYPFLEPSATSSIESQPSATTQAPAASTTSVEIVTGSGYHSVVGETGRGAVTFTYTTSNVAVPTVTPVPTTTDMPLSSPTSYVYGSGYASASGETGRSAVTFTYSASSAAVSSAEPTESTAWTSGHGGQHSYPWMTASAGPSTTELATTAAPPESTAWTSGHGGQHSYPWMSQSAESSQVNPTETISSVESALPTSLEEASTTLSSGIVTATLAPASSSSSAWASASTTVNSWLEEATKGMDPIHGGATSSTTAPQSTQSATESASSTGTSSLISEPIPTNASSSAYPTNATVTVSSNVETATATDSVSAPTSTQSANAENATATWASSSSGILVPTSAVENGTAIVLPTASITSQASEPALTASASVSDASDNGIATETVTDWDIVNATSTTYVPYETASVTATYSASENSTVWPTAAPTANVSSEILPTSTDALNVSISTVEASSVEPTGAFTSPIANETSTASATAGNPSVAPTASVTSTESAWESIVTASETYASSTASQSFESAIPTSTQSSWESVASASETTASSIASQSPESLLPTGTATSSAPASTETGSDEDECEEWEEVWVDERDIQDDWIIVE